MWIFAHPQHYTSTPTTCPPQPYLFSLVVFIAVGADCLALIVINQSWGAYDYTSSSTPSPRKFSEGKHIYRVDDDPSETPMDSLRSFDDDKIMDAMNTPPYTPIHEMKESSTYNPPGVGVSSYQPAIPTHFTTITPVNNTPEKPARPPTARTKLLELKYQESVTTKFSD